MKVKRLLGPSADLFLHLRSEACLNPARVVPLLKRLA
jgi:hypothetical protein